MTYNTGTSNLGLYPFVSKALIISALCSFPNDSSVILSSTAAFLLMLTNWLCSSLTTFPCASAITFATLTSSPGLSGSNTEIVNILPLSIRPC